MANIATPNYSRHNEGTELLTTIASDQHPSTDRLWFFSCLYLILNDNKYNIITNS